jgi:hypothetical protein
VKVTVRCNCESSYCTHTKADQPCSEDAKGSPYTMQFVGIICRGCASTITANRGGHYITFNIGSID